MDKIIRITLGLFVVVLVVFVAFLAYAMYVDHAYRTSLYSTYSYSCSITTDKILTNVTFFIPVPADTGGSSPVITRISAQDITGMPSDWNAVLFDTGKATLLKLTATRISPVFPPGNTTPVPLRFSVDVKTPRMIDTLTPLADDAMFRPVQSVRDVACPANVGSYTGSPHCTEYSTTIYADYTAAPDTRLSISAQVTGTNEWKVFEPRFNAYKNEIDLLMFGDNHGWITTKGWLESGIGYYDAPAQSVFT
ncbi:MAG: hypothetical protein WC295_12125 [Methanoregula sp.]|jgi:hypothetical protein